MTPRHLVIAARAATAPALAALAGAIVLADCTPQAGAAITFGSALVLLQAAPRIRAADLLAALVAFCTLAEWSRAAVLGELGAERWMACIAVAGAIVLMLKVQHLRALARQDAYVPLRQLERRSAILGRTSGAVARPAR